MQGEGVTAGLRKVKKGEGLADKPIPVPKVITAPKSTPVAAQEAARPPVFALNGKKWEVQYQVRLSASVPHLLHFGPY